MSEIEQRQPRKKKPGRWRRRLCAGFVILVLAIFLTGLMMSPGKGEMSGTGKASRVISIPRKDAALLLDVPTGSAPEDASAGREIAARLRKMIDRAGNTIVLNMQFLDSLRPRPGEDGAQSRDRAGLIRALTEKLRADPDTFVLFIVDPRHAAYASVCPRPLQPLADAGGTIVFPDLSQMPDGNHAYSPFHRVLRPAVTQLASYHKPMLESPFGTQAGGEEKISIGQYAEFLNFKADQRQIAAVRNRQGEWEALVMSAYPDARRNAAIYLRGDLAASMVENEYLIARASVLSNPEDCFGRLSAPELTREIEQRLKGFTQLEENPGAVDDGLRVQYLTEKEIGKKVDWMLAGAGEGDAVSLMMLHLSDPTVIDGLLAACGRGADIRLLLDPNKATGPFQSEGVPNRLAVEDIENRAETAKGELAVRYSETQGEPMRCKLIRIHNPQTGKEQLLLGSASITRRNLRGYNLEAAMYVEGASEAGRKLKVFFDDAWHGDEDAVTAVSSDAYPVQGATYVFGRIRQFLGTRLGMGTY